MDTKVYSAITAITGELAKVGLAKTNTNTQQGYKFRGIDDVYGALSGLLARYHLCVLPRVVDRQVSERETRNGGVLFYTVLRVEFDFVSAEDGSKHTICTVGEAMDSGDKSSNKAMSAAYKYACIQAFCIPTEGDNDADTSTHEVAAKGMSIEQKLALASTSAKLLASSFKAALKLGDKKVSEVHESANKDQELYNEAWGLLDSKERKDIKAAIERVRVPNTNRPAREPEHA